MNPILMEDLLGYRFLSGITVSPFENRAVFTVAVQDARSNGYKKNLWQVDPFTGKTEKLTSHGKAGAFLFEKAGTLLCQKPGKKPGTTDYEYLEMDTGKTEPAFTLPWAVNKLEKLCYHIKENALCGLGQTAPNPVLSTLKYFRDEYIAHIVDKKCPAGVCKALLTVQILPDKCKGCTICARNCPTGAITGKVKEPHVIDPDKCVKCGVCIEKCRFGAIVKK